MVTLDGLFARAGIDMWTRTSWFQGAELRTPYLFLDADAASIAFVTRNYLPSLQAVCPGLEIRPTLARPATVAKPKPQTRFPAIKSTGAARVWRDGLERDLLDS